AVAETGCECDGCHVWAVSRPSVSCAAHSDARVYSVRASGGIGRRAGFRCQWPQGRGGSSPPSRTANEEPLIETCTRSGEGLLRACPPAFRSAPRCPPALPVGYRPKCVYGRSALPVPAG